MAHLGSLGRGGAERARARARAVAPAREGCAGEGGYAGGADAEAGARRAARRRGCLGRGEEGCAEARMPRPGRGGRRGGGNDARSA